NTQRQCPCQTLPYEFGLRRASRSVAGRLAKRLAIFDFIVETFPASNGTRWLRLPALVSAESCAAAAGWADRSAPLRTEIPKNRSRCDRNKPASSAAPVAPSTA